MRFLLDTNILLPLEDSQIPLIGSLANFVRLAHEHGHQLVYHPASEDDIQRDSNQARRLETLARLRQYMFQVIGACILIDAVSRITQSGKTLLLDGHLALLNSAGKAEALSTKVFADLGIDGIVMIHDKPSSIVERLKQRDGDGIGFDEIKALQSLENIRAKIVTGELGLPLFRVKAFDDSTFSKALGALR